MNAHPDIEGLLALRDEPSDGAAPDAATAEHVAACATCRAELARLRALRDGLRALPPVPPGPELWARVVAAVEPPVRVVARRSRVRLLVAGVAASAAFAASVALVVLQDAPGSATAPEATPVALAGADPSIGDLKLRSQRLEAVLAALQSQPRVTTARSAGTIAELEDGIALVDYQLGQVEPDERDAALQRALWKKRVELMESLVTVRYAGERADSI